jgi:hypothetical protein
MGCDYYIEKLLRIYYNIGNESNNETNSTNSTNNITNNYLDIELTKEKGYFNDDFFDEDEEDYEEKITEFRQKCLIPSIEPITIYKKNFFIKPLFETKYKNLIENEINKNNVKWTYITIVLKLEERYKVN